MSHNCQRALYNELCEELDSVLPPPFMQGIYTVHDQLRKVNEKAYEPELIAVGPYHHGKENLDMMEQYKFRYLNLLIQRQYIDLRILLDVVTRLERQVRICYAKSIIQTPNELIKMMLVDGCFIIELFRKFNDPLLREPDDLIFNMEWMIASLQRDLILFENQLPFFVLCELFDVIEDENCHQLLVDYAVEFFSSILPGEGYRGLVDDGNFVYRYNHLLGLVHDEWLPSFSMVDFGGDLDERGKWDFIPCATELEEAGVTIRKSENRIFDIKFLNKALKIPPLIIEDRTESVLRNLIAYEQYDCDYPRARFKFVTDYVTFLDCLVDTPKDVQILRASGIIVNWKSNDEWISTLFNDIHQSVVEPNKRFFSYVDVFNNVNGHCSKRVNRWQASFRRTYLSSPWTILSLAGGIFLLLLSLLQTIFTIKK